MMCLYFSVLSPGRLVNCVSTWTPLRRSSIKLYDAQMSSSCLIGTSPTASIPSRVCREQDQVASINGHPICRLQRSKSSSPTPKNKIQLNAMFTEGILDPGYFTEAAQKHTLTIAGVRDVTVEITGGLRIDRHVLLVHCYNSRCKCSNSAPMTMSSPV